MDILEELDALDTTTKAPAVSAKGLSPALRCLIEDLNKEDTIVEDFCQRNSMTIEEFEAEADKWAEA